MLHFSAIPERIYDLNGTGLSLLQQKSHIRAIL